MAGERVTVDRRCDGAALAQDLATHMRSFALLAFACLATAGGCAAYVGLPDWLAAMPALCPMAAGAGAVAMLRLAWLTNIPDLGLSVMRTRSVCAAHVAVGEACVILVHAGFGLAVACIVVRVWTPLEAPGWALRSLSGFLGLLTAYVAVRSLQVHLLHLRLLRTEARMAAGVR